MNLYIYIIEIIIYNTVHCRCSKITTEKITLNSRCYTIINVFLFIYELETRTQLSCLNSTFPFKLLFEMPLTRHSLGGMERVMVKSKREVYRVEVTEVIKRTKQRICLDSGTESSEFSNVCLARG